MTDPVDREAIVVIDDDYAMRLSCRQILVKAGHRVEVFGDGAQGLAGVARERPALVLVDLKMPGLSGLEVIRRIHEIDPSIVVVVITGYATVDTAIEAMKAGAYDFLSKPFSPDQLRMITGRALERRRLQQESRRAELERALVERRFVSFVSHQLKSPLAAVQQYLEVLERLAGNPEIEARREEWIARSLERIREMRALIDDWLTLARVEGNHLVGRREPVAVEPILRHLLEVHRERAEERGVSLALELAPGAYVVEGDPTCIGVLFENLLDNAVKYNRPGGAVTVAAELAAGEVVVAVRDTGEGIPEEALPRLFDELFQVQRPAGPQVGGTGLGLPICRRIAHELGGQIEVESTPGEGSTFRVRLPAHRAADAPGQAPAETPPREVAAEPAAPTLEPAEVSR
jgi:two-component system, sensor histidine kinase and response regulator